MQQSFTSAIRKNFYIPNELNQRVEKVAEELGSTWSEIVRNALVYYVERIEAEKLEEELEAGYKS